MRGISTFLFVALATTFVHCDKEKAPKIDPNAVKTAADLEKLLSEMSEKGFHEAVDLLSRGEMELDQEKMAVFEKYLESHEAVLDLFVSDCGFIIYMEKHENIWDSIVVNFAAFIMN
jgi:hypothetical protein